MRLIFISLILVLCDSLVTAVEEIEDCQEYSLRDGNQQVTVSEKMLMDIYLYQLPSNSTGDRTQENPPTPGKDYQDHTPWEVIASIEDSRGSWCNMTVSKDSIMVDCSSGASGNYTSDLEPLFTAGKRKKLLLDFDAVTNYTERKTESDTAKELSSGISTTPSTTSFGVGLQGEADYLFVLEDANITSPLTLRWPRVNFELRVVYNCWDRCIRSKKLNKIQGSRAFYLRKEKGFEGVNVTFTVLGESSYYHLKPEDVRSFDMHQWFQVSLRRESKFLKVYIGSTEKKKITNLKSSIITSMEVELMGRGSLTWCGSTTSSVDILLIIIWILIAGCFILAIYSVTIAIRAYRDLKQWKINEQWGVNTKVLPPLYVEGNEPNSNANVDASSTSGESINSIYGKGAEYKNNSFITVPNSVEERTSIVSIPEAGPDEDNNCDVISTCSTDLPIAISAENNFDLDSSSSIELPRGIRANKGSSSSNETASMTVIDDAANSETQNPQFSYTNHPKVSDGFPVSVRKRSSEFATLSSNGKEESDG